MGKLFGFGQIFEVPEGAAGCKASGGSYDIYKEV